MGQADQGQQPAAIEAAPALDHVLLDRIVEESGLGKDDLEEKRKSKDWIQTFLDEIVADNIRVKGSTDAMLTQRIAQIDRLISDQLNEILHHENFQRVEATWRGINYVTQQTETSPMLKIKAINLSKRDLLKDLRNASEFDQSGLFKRVYEEEYGTLGGHPFGVLVGDYEFGRRNEDIEVLEKISGLAAAAHAPFVSAANPQMFGWEGYTQLTSDRDLARIFESEFYVRWRMFRQREDSRYVALTLPHILLREPYSPEGVTVDTFVFDEKVDGRDHRKYLWGNAAYALAARITDSFSRYEWCIAIRGVEGGGLVEDLPVHTFVSEDGKDTMKCPTELAIPDRREKEFADLGFVPLCHEKRSNRAVFFGVQSCQKPRGYEDKKAEANAVLSAQIPYMMAASRFAHFFKAIARDKVGSFQERAQFERFLNDWISPYVLLDDYASQEAKASHPLREAKIEVKNVPGKPGSYRAIAYLRPHFQLDALTASLRLVAEIPAKK